MLERTRRKGNPSALLVAMQIRVATVENSMEGPQKLEMELPNDPAIPLLGIHRKKPNTPIQRNIRTYFHCSIIYNSQGMEATPLPYSKPITWI